MANNYTRRISLYINGKEVTNTIAAIKQEMYKLINTQAHMTRGTKEYVQAAEDIRRLKSIIAEHNSQLKATSSVWGKMKGSIAGGYNALVVYAAAIMGVAYSFKKLYDAAEEQRVADRRLLFALKGNIDAYQQLNKQSSELQLQTGIEDSVISQIQMLGVQSGKSVEDVKKITQAAIELSSVTGDDLQSSFMQLNKTYTGVIGKSLPRLSADFANLTKEQLENGAAIDLVLTKYKGTAAESATEVSKMTQAWGEFQEALGNGETGPVNWLIVKMTSLLGILKDVTEVFFSFGGSRDAWEAQKDGVQSTAVSVSNFRKEMELAQKDESRWSNIKKNGVESLNKSLEKQQQILNNTKSQISNSHVAMRNDGSGAITSEEMNNLKIKQQYEQASVNTIKSKISLLNGMINPQNNTDDEDGSKANTKRAKRQAAEKERLKEIEEAYKLEQEIKKRESESSLALMQEGYDKELLQLTSKYNAERELIVNELSNNKKLTVEEKESLNQTIANIDQKYLDDLEKLNHEKQLNAVKSEKQLIDLKLEAVKEGSAEEFKLKSDQLQKQMQLDIEEVKGTEEQKQEIINAIHAKYIKLQANLDKQYSIKTLDDRLTQEITKLTAAEKLKIEELDKNRKSGEISQKEYNKQLISLQQQFTNDSLTISINKAQSELDILKAAGEDTVQAEAALAALRLKAQENTSGKNEQAPGGWQDWSTEDKLSLAVDSASQIADAEFQIQKDNNQRELDETLSKLEKEREAELSNKRLTESQKVAINQKYDAQAKAAKQAAWKKQHKADVTQAWVNLALGVGKAAINIWPVPAIPMMAAAAIAGGLQVATVTGQKMPEFSEGGFTLSDSSNKKPAGIVHANEYVIPEAGVNNPSLGPLIGMLEVARQSGNLPTLDVKKILQSIRPGFSEGGSTSKDMFSNLKLTNNDPADAVQQEILYKLAETVDNLTDRLNKGIKSTVEVRGKNGINEKLAEDQQTRNNAYL